MKFIQQTDTSVYLLKLYVKPNSRKQQIKPYNLDDEYLIINLRSKPVKNKANRELISLFKNKFRKRLISIELSKGAKTSNKIVKLVFKDAISKNKVFELITQ